MHSKKYYVIYGLFFSLFVAAILCLCMQFWPVIVIVAFLCDPAAGGLAAVITGERIKKDAQKASQVIQGEEAGA